MINFPQSVLFILPSPFLDGNKGVKPRGLPIESVMHATVIKNAGHMVELLDAYHEALTFAEIIKFILNKSFDWIVIPYAEYLRETDLEVSFYLAKAIRDVSAIPIAIFSRWTIDKDSFQKELSFDFFLHGDSEYPLLELISANTNNEKELIKISGLWFKRLGEWKMLSRANQYVSLDILPIADWSLIDFKNQRVMPHRYKQRQFHMIDISRGCPTGHCNYCRENLSFAGKSGLVYRFRSPTSVVNEMVYMYNKRGIVEFKFDTAQFPTNKDWIFEFSELLVSKSLNLKWNCLSRADLLTSEILRMMSRAGCDNILIGIETLDDVLQKKIKKYTKKTRVNEAVYWCNFYGINVTGSFMMAIPGERPMDVLRDAFWAAENGVTFYQLFIAKWQLGMPSTFTKDARLVTSLDITPNDFMGQYTVPEKYFSIRHLRFIKKLAYVIFYFHPKTIVRLISDMKNPEDLMRYLSGLKVLIKI